ncbi:hypothetical protein PENTCL1PPCAC_9246, partial [Pristionchus entomophagus]
SGMFGTAYNLFTLTVERLIASIIVDRYENLCNNFPLLGILLFLAHWSISTSIMYLSYQDIISNEVLIISILTSVILSIILFALLPRISEYVYKRQMDQRFGSVRRYQSIENLRSATV